MNLRQRNINPKMSLYLSFLGSRKLKSFTSGNCFGFAVCEEMMLKMGKPILWKAVKEEWVKWDGTLAALDELITLPGSSEAIPRRVIFEDTIRYVLAAQGDGTQTTKQLDFLKPGSPLTLIDQHHKQFRIKSYFVVGAHFNEKTLGFCLNDAATRVAIQNSICIIGSDEYRHCGLLGLNKDETWRFFDANYEEGVSKIFSNIEGLIAEVFNQLGQTLTLHLGSFDELTQLKEQPFAFFKAAILTSPMFDESLLYNHGLHTFIRRTPDLVPALLAKYPHLPFALLNQRDHHDHTPFMLAILKNQPKTIKALTKMHAFDPRMVNAPLDARNRKPIVLAIASGATEALALLLNLGADANIFEEDGDTPLHGAVLKENLEAALYLLLAGAKVNAINRLGETPLSMAVQANQTRMALVFLGMSANLRVRNRQGQCLLSIAALNKNALLLKAFCERGVNPNLVGASKVTPLINAVTTGQLELVQILLTHQANPWYQCPEQDYLQYLRVQSIELDCVYSFLQLIDMNTKTTVKPVGFTAIHMAVFLNHPEIVNELLNAMPGMTLNELKRLNDLALTLNHPEISDLLKTKMLPLLSIKHSFFKHMPVKNQKKRTLRILQPQRQLPISASKYKRAV